MSFKVARINLALIARTHSFRCDAKHYATEVMVLDRKVREKDFFEIGDFLPNIFVKGVQPTYIDVPGEDSVPVINTLSVQKLEINEGDCRYISRDDFDELDADRRLKDGDVLLTMDGGVSIGKSALFDRSGDFTVDSHVCVLRPVGMKPVSLVYLLASPLGQAQFRRAESGASGQTAVTEEDVRGFVFPKSLLEKLDEVVAAIEQERRSIRKERDALAAREIGAWAPLNALLP